MLSCCYDFLTLSSMRVLVTLSRSEAVDILNNGKGRVSYYIALIRLAGSSLCIYFSESKSNLCFLALINVFNVD